MGGRRLPGATALGLIVVLVLVLAACKSGHSAAEASPSPVAASPAPSATPTTRPTATPTATATPHPLAKLPVSVESAIATLVSYRASHRDDPCPAELEERWEARCGRGDVDGDGVDDTVYLVPLHPAVKLSPSPGVVLIVRDGVPPEPFPRVAEADASIVGVALFSVADRTGDGQAEVTHLVNTCGANGCRSQVEVQSWDGTAWRDIGPGDGGIDNVESVGLEGEGVGTEIMLRGGTLHAAGAGPTRATTHTYGWNGSRYHEVSAVADPPAYLIHAIYDADALVAAGRFDDAAAAYAAAIADDSLKDWKAESGNQLPGAASGREQLRGYALFRIAVVRAATGADPTLALDTVIAESQEPLFSNAAEAFRRGYREFGGVRAGCLEVTRYLTTPTVPEYLTNLFDYGFANPRRLPADVCPF